MDDNDQYNDDDHDEDNDDDDDGDDDDDQNDEYGKKWCSVHKKDSMSRKRYPLPRSCSCFVVLDGCDDNHHHAIGSMRIIIMILVQ